MGLVLLRCKTPEAAVTALQKDRARVIGGGTMVVRMTNTGDVSIDTLVRLETADSRAIRMAEGRVYLGAGITMSEVIRHPDLGWLAPAARAVGGPAVRNAATVGGNLFGKAPYGDFATALVALDACVTLHGVSGPERLPIVEFFARHATGLPRQPAASTDLAPADGRKVLVETVDFSTIAPAVFLFRKVTRTRPKGLAILTIAAALLEGDSVITSARIAYGAMAATPIRARAVEAALIGKPRTLAGTGAALAAALHGTQPTDDSISSAWYKAAVLPVHLRRLLLNEGESR